MQASSSIHRRPDKSAGTSLIFLGNFNPAIFQPAWLIENELIADDEDSVELEAITNSITSWGQDWLKVVVQPERCELHATDAVTSFGALADLAEGLFSLLPHTPITAFGINRYAHIEMESDDAWNELGFSLFTRDLWDAVIDDPRMLTVQVQAYAADNYGGKMTATVQSSQIYRRAVFVATNDHYARPDDDRGASNAIGLLREVFPVSIDHSAKIIEKIRGL